MKCTRKACKHIFLNVLALFAIFFIFVTSFTNDVFANSAETTYLIPGGETIGIKVETGVFIAGKYQVDTDNGKVAPWKESDLRTGDKILAIDGSKVMNNQDIIEILKTVAGDTVVLTVKRGQITFDTNILVVSSKSSEKSIGLYIKDRILGVGTLTFINPITHQFGSLGHGIYDDSLPLGQVQGNILESSIASIKKALPGTPGEKRALMKKDILGDITLNSTTGLYGIVHFPPLLQKEVMPVASQSEVKVGPAYLMTVVNGGNIEKFDIQIIEVQKQNTPSVKGLKVQIVDQDLIQKTGGIVQGMSGSPIIQDGKIVGAISHVTVENPLIGYGIHIEWMIQEFANFDKD